MLKEAFQGLVNRLRKKENVVGVWSGIKPGSSVSVTTELGDGTGRQVKLGESGAVTHGRVVRRRVVRGRPNRDTVFVADSGEETMLESQEF